VALFNFNLEQAATVLSVVMLFMFSGPFLLTNLLLDCMIQTSNVLGEGRIINVTCAAHNQEGGWGRGSNDFSSE